MIVSVSAEKGGVGKSTIAVNLAVHLARENIDVAVLDTDAQATAMRFVERREVAGLAPTFTCVARNGEIGSTLRDLARRYQVVIVDAGGRDSREMRSAMAVADLMLIPTRASQADLETLPKVNELITLAREFNPKLRASAVLSMTPTNPTITEAVRRVSCYPASINSGSQAPQFVTGRSTVMRCLPARALWKCPTAKPAQKSNCWRLSFSNSRRG
ncbi:ParA family protein [Burkholderia sp. Bp9131]|uniref:ParA family protein n=1 Tax=Burkholderia sp. Bp9131 TaxID=2184571 RepID=UPI0021AB8523|nr:ParA family protein [Burkholderia sp. Bp9131]